jgi:hypothetical protein
MKAGRYILSAFSFIKKKGNVTKKTKKPERVIVIKKAPSGGESRRVGRGETGGRAYGEYVVLLV